MCQTDITLDTLAAAIVAQRAATAGHPFLRTIPILPIDAATPL